MAYNTLCGTVNFCDDSGSIESMVDDYSNQTIAGRKTFSTPVTASAFYDSTSGAPLSTAAIRSISGDGAKRVVVSDGDGTATAYAGFTFDGSALTSSYFSGSAAGLLAIPLHSHKVVGNLSASNIYFGLGLENSSETLAVKGGNSITVGAGGVAVDLATTGGLAHASAKLRVDPNDATAKGSLSNNDSFLLSDSDASNVLKKSTMSTLSTYMQETLTFIGPGGSNNQVQYKNGSAFAGSSNFTFDGTNTVTTVNVSASGFVSSSQFVGNGSGLTGITGVNASGVNQSVQFNSGSTFSGSANLIFDFSAGTNALKTTGDMSASNDILGGRDLSLLRDLSVGRHISATGQISSSANISASAFYGQGHTLTTAPINNYTANRLVLCGGTSNTLDTTANLAWNNPTLNVPGNVVASNLSGAAMNINGTARVTGSLEITGSDAHLLVLHAKGSDTTREIVFRKDYTTDAGSLYINSSEHMFLRNETNQKDIVFRTFSTNPLRIFGANASVGIGNKSAAAALLDVGGDTIVSGSLTVSASSGVAIDSFHNPTGLSNDTGGGEVVMFGGGSLTAGKLYYLHTDGNWTETDADAVATGADQMLGIALGSTPALHGVLIRGFFDAHTYLSNFSAGKAIYVSATAASMNTTAPAGSGDFVRIVGYCTTTANVIYFNPSSEWIELD